MYTYWFVKWYEIRIFLIDWKNITQMSKASYVLTTVLLCNNVMQMQATAPTLYDLSPKSPWVKMNYDYRLPIYLIFLYFVFAISNINLYWRAEGAIWKNLDLLTTNEDPSYLTLDHGFPVIPLDWVAVDYLTRHIYAVSKIAGALHPRRPWSSRPTWPSVPLAGLLPSPSDLKYCSMNSEAFE